MEKSPDAFRTISEAAEELGLPQHVLRFWETRFSTIKPLKRGGGRRYYRPEDVLLLKGIRHLLYDRGFTIKGVQRILKTQGSRYVVAIADGAPIEDLIPLAADSDDRADEEPVIEPTIEPVLGEAPHHPFEPPIVEPRPHPAGPEPGPRHHPEGAGLTTQDRERLERVLRELLDCKRILERARET